MYNTRTNEINSFYTSGLFTLIFLFVVLAAALVGMRVIWCWYLISKIIVIVILK